jgi:hypothetical protein
VCVLGCSRCNNRFFNAIERMIAMLKRYKRNPLRRLREHLDTAFIVHYSSQPLNDSNESYSPRITSIAVHDLESNTTHSFSIHLEAEVSRVSKSEVEGKYDELEKAMIANFYDFVNKHINHCWVHWNMRNIHFGFEQISHRYKVLGATSNDIPMILGNKRFNLSDMILDIYGEDCISHPRMAKLMQMNGGEPRGFLSGESEAKAFSDKEYVKLHQSTLCKVGWFQEMLLLLLERKIKTERSNWYIKAHAFCDSIWLKILASFGVIYALIDGAIKLFQHKFPLK